MKNLPNLQHQGLNQKMTSSENIIQIKNLSKRYQDGFKALKSVNLNIKKGEIFALLGPNGAGKTTLINMICGIVNIREGAVSISGNDVVNDYRLTRKLVGLVPQELTSETFETVLGTVNFSRGLFGKKENNKYIEKPNIKIDAVIFMACSLCPIHPETKDNFQKYVTKYSEIIRAKDAEPMLFMSWPYGNRPKMIDSLRKVFVNTANKNNLLLIPAGEAFYKFSQAHPDINLYTDDYRHPSKEGTYLAAAVVFATLYGKATAGNQGIMNLDKDIALKIQLSVDKTVSEFLGVVLK